MSGNAAAFTKLPLVRVLVSIALGAIAACAKPAPPPTAPIRVTVARVRRGAAARVIAANGRVEPLETARVAAQVSGLVSEVDFREGDTVRRGEVLFRIVPRPYAAALAGARAALARDEALAEDAKRQAGRLQELAKYDYVTPAEAGTQSATAAADAATVAADRAAIRKAQFDLQNTVVRAPIGGRTGSVLVRRGNLVAADPSQALVVINRIDPILVRFNVPATILPDVQSAGQARPLPVVAQAVGRDTASEDSVEGSLPDDSASSTVVAHPGAGAPRGTLVFVDNAVDTATGTVQLKARFPNPGGQLWPGQSVTVALQLGVQANALLVPSKAVQTGQQGSYVFVVQPDDRAVMRPVVVGGAVGDATVVERGLSDGERVVTIGQAQVVAGAHVRVAGEYSTVRTAEAAP